MILFETERLVVQRFKPDEEELFFQVNGNPEVMHYIRPAKTKEASGIFFRENLDFYLDHSILGRYAVFQKEDGQFVGTFAFLYLSGEADYHLGYALLPAAWNLGFATELVRAAIPYFFAKTTHPAVFAIVSPENTASSNVLLKVGFAHKERSEEGGKPVDVYFLNRNLGTAPHIQEV